MSLYSEYLLEKTEDNITETDKGFITWRYMDNNQVYIVDIFVRPEFRNENVASELADEVVKAAKEKGYKQLLGTVVVSTKNSDASLRVLQAYGMSLYSAAQNLIVMKKDI